MKTQHRRGRALSALIAAVLALAFASLVVAQSGQPEGSGDAEGSSAADPAVPAEASGSGEVAPEAAALPVATTDNWAAPDPAAPDGAAGGGAVGLLGAAVSEGSGEAGVALVAAVAPEPARAHEELAAEAAATDVIDLASRLVPRPRDPRMLVIRAGDVTQELADVLGVPLNELTSPEVLRTRIAEFETLLATLTSDLETARAGYSALVARANAGFDALLAVVDADPLLAARLVAFRNLARQQAAVVRRIDSDRLLATAALEFLRRRVEVLETTVSVAVTEQVAAQNTEIAAERERLQQETAVTDAVATRAREAEERARAEREAARDETERRIAERWGSLAPRLAAIVPARTAEQEVIAQITARREEFAASQIERAATIVAILAEPERVERRRRADAFLDVLIAERNGVREVAQARRSTMRERRTDVETKRAAFEDLRRQIESADLGGADVGAELRAQLREVSQEELQVLEQEVALAEFRFANAESVWGLNEAQINFYGRSIDQLVPEISRARQRALFAINRDNLREVRRNLAERVTALRLLIKDTFGDQEFFAAEGGASREKLLRPAVLLLLLLIGVKVLPRYRDAVIIRLLTLRTHPRFRRAMPLLLKTGEVIHETFSEGIQVLAIYGASRVLDDAPALHVMAVWLFWISIYRFIVRFVATMALPRTAREPVLIGEPPDEFRLGVDVFQFDERRGSLILRSVRMVLLYLVAGRIGLAAVRFLFGPGFFFYWSAWVFNAALLVLVYAIAWYWRKEIVEIFVRRTGERSRKFGEWLNAHTGKPYSVLVVILLAAYLITMWLVRLLAAWASGRGIGRFVANFAVRKKLERAAGDTQNIEAVKRTVLPVAYQRIFQDRPLEDEAYLVSREKELGMVVPAFAHWLESSGHGTVAVVGDAGSGKTTFGHEIANSFESDHEVREVAITDKLLSARSVHEWMCAAFALDCEPEREAIIAQLETRTPCMVVVDQCENLFLRSVGGFAGVDEFLDFCTLTNHRVFWVLIFDKYPWNYLHRVRDRRGYFREIIELRPFTDEQLRAMIERRNEAVGVHPNFDRLVGAAGEDDQHFELVKTAGGFFRLLAEYSRGNLRVALHFWMRSLIKEPDGGLYVTLFARPDSRGLKAMNDELLFALTSLAQHRALSVGELSDTLDSTRSRTEVTMNLLEETGYVEESVSPRYRIATHMYFAVLNRLREENFLHLD